MGRIISSSMGDSGKWGTLSQMNATRRAGGIAKARAAGGKALAKLHRKPSRLARAMPATAKSMLKKSVNYLRGY